MSFCSDTIAKARLNMNICILGAEPASYWAWSQMIGRKVPLEAARVGHWAARDCGSELQVAAECPAHGRRCLVALPQNWMKAAATLFLVMDSR